MMDFAKLAQDPGTLVLGYNGRIDQFTRSPLRPRARASAMRWMFSSLLRFNEDCNLTGDLAERWERSTGWPHAHFRIAQECRLARRPPCHGRRRRLHRRACSSGRRAISAIRCTCPRASLPFSRRQARTRWRSTTARPYAALPSYLTGTWASLFLIMPRHVVERVGEAQFEAQSRRQRPLPFWRDHRGRPRRARGPSGLFCRRA